MSLFLGHMGKEVKKRTSTLPDTTRQGKRYTASKEVGTEQFIIQDPQAQYAVREPQKVLEIMGLPSKNALDNPDTISYFIHLIRHGIPKKAIDALLTKTGITESELASILHISTKTLQRREEKDLLNPEQSERLIEIAKLYSRGKDVFGSLEDFIDWMNSPVMALGNQKPKSFLDTSLGIVLLLNELGRIEHGVYS